MYYDLNNELFIEEKTNILLSFMYNTIIGRFILKIATTKIVANIYSTYLNSKFSKRKIKSFVKKNHINMDEYKETDYNSFNDFFIREIKPNKRKIEDNLIAVCDSKLSVYKLDENSSFKIKNSIYTVKELIGEDRFSLMMEKYLILDILMEHYIQCNLLHLKDIKYFMKIVEK